jgi:hypothetical protein
MFLSTIAARVLASRAAYSGKLKFKVASLGM